MQSQKYSVNQHLIESLLVWVKSGEIAIPEIQRPFVWDGAKVRDLMDSLYQGYPIGYIITWRNPDIKLKDGSLSEGKKILIDGQQRITALRAALLDEYVVNKHYKQVKIKISFNPNEEKFEVQNPAILKDKSWLPDISTVINGNEDLFDLVPSYLELNPDADKTAIRKAFTNLLNIPKKQVGLIDLTHDLDIEVVTEIFIRINSQGVVLSQADFAMSKIASNDNYGGNILRKAIDYFCHLATAPEFFAFIRDNDSEFARTDYFRKMSWLKDENDDLYDPSYTDLLRVAFTTQFNRGRLSVLVSLLSGRNFETRTFEDQIAKESFETLGRGIELFINETNFKRFVMIIKSSGFVIPGMISSQNALNFAYIVYLKLRNLNYSQEDIESYVRRWFVYTVLTGRYSGSPESLFDYDIRQIAQRSFDDYLKEKEAGDLSDAFWNVSLVQKLSTSNSNSPSFSVFLASQIKNNDKGFLSNDITVGDLIKHRGDIHHLFPKDYLKKNGLTRSRYNQVANYVYMQQEINIKVGNKAPKEYLGAIIQQCETGELKYGRISDLDELMKNLEMHCIPQNIFDMVIDDYDSFLEERRKLMAIKIRDYYFGL
jgi:hypothetical protein